MLEGQEPVRLLLAEDGRDLLGRPGERQPFDAVGVGVLCRGEPALGQPELAQDVVQGLLGHPAVALLAGHDPGAQVGGREQRVVVEHLLEVGDEPPRVHGVAVEPAAEEVVHPARRHPVEGQPHHAQRVLVPGRGVQPEQELDRRGGGELGRRAPAAFRRVEAAAQRRDDTAEEPGGQRLGRGRLLARLPDRVDEDVRLLLEVVAARPVGLRHGLQHLLEAGQAVPRLGREVGSAVEGPAVRRQEDGHRPAAVAGHGDDRVHVEPVDVGPLLAVDLDADEELVHEARRRLVLERLVLHDMAPVAGGVADGEEHRTVLGARERERLVAPGLPVDRVVGVLEEVGAGLGGQAVHAAQPSQA